MYQFITEYYVILIPITVFIIGLSDLLDGFLARYLGQHSYLGKFLDPLRDKLLMLAVLGNILYLYHANLWLFVPICIAAFCECVVITQNVWYLRQQVSSRVHFTGKIRMLIVLMCIFAILTQIYWLEEEFIPAAIFVWIIALLSVFRFLMKTFVLIKTYQQSKQTI